MEVCREHIARKADGLLEHFPANPDAGRALLVERDLSTDLDINIERFAGISPENSTWIAFHAQSSVWRITLLRSKEGNEVKGDSVRTNEAFFGLDMGKRHTRWLYYLIHLTRWQDPHMTRPKPQDRKSIYGGY